MIIKSANQDVTNAGLTNDSELLFTVVANNRYAILMDLFVSSNNADSDYAMNFTLSSGTMKGRGSVQTLDGAPSPANLLLNASAAANTGTAVTGTPSDIDVVIAVRVQYAFTCTANATLQFRFGNNATGSGRTSRTNKGSVMRYKNIT